MQSAICELCGWPSDKNREIHIPPTPASQITDTAIVRSLHGVKGVELSLRTSTRLVMQFSCHSDGHSLRTQFTTRHCIALIALTSRLMLKLEISKIGFLSGQQLIGYLPDHRTTDAPFTSLMHNQLDPAHFVTP